MKFEVIRKIGSDVVTYEDVSPYLVQPGRTLIHKLHIKRKYAGKGVQKKITGRM